MNDWSSFSVLPPKELREIQNRTLRFFLQRHLYPFSPYYRRLFNRHHINPARIKTVQDLSVIPFTQKQDLLPTKDSPNRFYDFVLQPQESSIRKYWSKGRLMNLALAGALKGKGYLQRRLREEYRPVFLTATTGTTNQPASFLYSSYDLENLRQSGYRLLEVLGGWEDSRAVNLFPYAPHLAFWQTVFAGFSHHNFMLSTGGGKVMGTEGNIETISKVRPHILIGIPGYLYHLVRAAREMEKDFSFVQKVVLGGSSIPLGFKEKMAALLRSMGARHVRILGTYGFTEAKCAWGECPTALKISSGYHVYPDKAIFEVIDPETGQVRKEGEDGELVFTNIDARGSCVLRYRTGDLVRGGITFERCPYCKRTLPRLSSRISRAFDIKSLRLSKIKGATVNLSTLESILESERGVDEWQIQIRKKDDDPYEIDELIVYLSVAGSVHHQALREKLKDKIFSSIEVTPNEIVVLSRREMLERVEMESSHKQKRIVDTRPEF